MKLGWRHWLVVGGVLGGVVPACGGPTPGNDGGVDSGGSDSTTNQDVVQTDQSTSDIVTTNDRSPQADGGGNDAGTGDDAALPPDMCPAPTSTITLPGSPTDGGVIMGTLSGPSKVNNANCENGPITPDGPEMVYTVTVTSRTGV